MAMKNRERLLRKLKALPPAVRKHMREAIVAGAEQVVAAQKRLAPRKTGALAASIDYSMGSYTPANPNVRGVTSGGGAGDPDLTAVVHAGDAKAFYAAFVEFGTAPHSVAKGGGTKVGKLKAKLGRGVPHPGATAQPFFYPAWRANKKSVKARISRAMRKGIKEATGN